MGREIGTDLRAVVRGGVGLRGGGWGEGLSPAVKDHITRRQVFGRRQSKGHISLTLLLNLTCCTQRTVCLTQGQGQARLGSRRRLFCSVRRPVRAASVALPTQKQSTATFMELLGRPQTSLAPPAASQLLLRRHSAHCGTANSASTSASHHELKKI